MKIYKAIPAIIALIVIFSAPFSYLPLCGEAQRGLVCYCCANSPEKCRIMTACLACQAEDGADSILFAPEMVLPSLGLHFYLHPRYFENESPHLPGIVYLEVPVRPPIII